MLCLGLLPDNPKKPKFGSLGPSTTADPKEPQIFYLPILSSYGKTERTNPEQIDRTESGREDFSEWRMSFN